ncbi:SusD/RagB family nutrient-binding outer membrane lipoprotein [Natronoflexus pectinivorans]|uniref:SusD-like starch-binding protein associating with outer membrane n=1 Tax=Natronoflexus pectinivorans TaxID=682526 RepID=A0A4R2GQV3_9BACT|nr:SusD/RagB family nutrient-binding outer membrane lipoprotein [Natronoflexus pectinivorans]TCO10496.1 SusD-like starch-binding protein associating with outer membrane [Natronoflexus pectinivorans]
MYKYRINFALLFAGLLLLASCDDFLDVNDNPNSPVSENLELSAKLPAALVYTSIQETGQLNQLGAFWGGYWGNTAEAVNRFVKERTYNGTAIAAVRDGIHVWENNYQALLYYHLIEDEALNKNELFYAGIAQIMKGWHFMRLVDVYGDVPFDEALQGTRYAEPVYEPGEDVYRKAINLITEGIQSIKSAPAYAAPGNDDVVFSGNAQLWAKFGNTIKLRGLIRQSEAGNQSYINQQLAIIESEGSGFLHVGEMAVVQPGYQNITGKMNPFWSNYYRSVQGVSTNNLVDLAPTQFAIDAYAALNDPRLSLLYTIPDNADVPVGVLFGDASPGQEHRRENVSAFMGPVENNGQPAALFKSATQASVLMGDFESLFLQAEAAYRGWIAGDAATLYRQAVTASMHYMEVIDSDLIEAYLQQPEVVFNSSLEQIILQKWLALNSISSFEAWSDFRRLNMPAIPNSLSAPSAQARPLRLMYPESEVQSNGREVEKMGITDITSKGVWWMK